jgi:hypothetical protein
MPGNNQKSEIMGGSGDQEQSFSIQPHPAVSLTLDRAPLFPHFSSTRADTIEQKTNDPADLRQEPPQLGGGLNSNPEWAAFSAKGPYQPAAEVMQNVPAPATRDELKARSAELNK